MNYASGRFLIALIAALFAGVSIAAAGFAVAGMVGTADAVAVAADAVDVAGDRPLRLRVSLSKRKLDVIEGGKVVKSYPVAVGRPSNPTPTGNFRTGRIEWNPRWVPPPRDWARNMKPREPGDPKNPMQGVKIYFRGPWYYIHGTNDPASIGRAASRGCIRTKPSDATDLARRVERAGGGVPLRIVR